MKSRTVGQSQWQHLSETIAALPKGVFNVGVGDDLTRVTGMTLVEICDALCPVATQMIDGGANIATLAYRGQEFVVYVRRRGKAIDLGTRIDFQALGWEPLCDLLDKERK